MKCLKLVAPTALAALVCPPALAQELPAVPAATVGFVSEAGGRIVGVTDRPTPRMHAEFVQIDDVDVMSYTTAGLHILDDDFKGGFGTRGCVQRSAYVTDLDPGSYNAQAGFAEHEICAAQYFVPANAFPIKIEQMNCLFATSGATVQTTTEWSVLVWDGPPNTGTLVAEFSSDDIILPHLVMPPGNGGTEIQVSVDPGDPEQIIITNQSGTNSFTIGFRIDHHNNQTQNPCFVAPPNTSNAFPTTDTDGLASPANNWLFAVDCGFLGGWNRFSQLGIFQPSGDWGLEAYWSSFSCAPDVGACCVDGNCSLTTQGACTGTYGGDGSTCDDITCLPPSQACCFPSTGGCLTLPPGACMTANGIPGGPGTTCTNFTCFPVGASCLPDGSCVDGVTPEESDALGGIFMGDGSTCATAVCPEPMGACSFGAGACISLTSGDCAIAGGSWCGPGTSCDDDADGDGIPDGCDNTCPADLAEPIGTLDFSDVIAFLTAFANMTPEADLALPIGTFDFSDVIAFLQVFGEGCP
ncbi:MAG: GC-type dockerin domain-anchored protein [Phycisphaerales bacterium]